jgi:hypothetical protein
MIGKKMAMPRRTFLRGVGATLALPLLDCMTPAFTRTVKSAARAVPRLGAIYLPNGVNMWKWTPSTEGPNFQFSSILSPLEPFRRHVTVLSGLSNLEADGRPGEGIGDHSRAQTAWLTGVHAKKTEGADIEAGISMDQIVARHYAKDTQLASLELALEANDLSGGCEDGYSCAYTGTVAWRSEREPLPMEAEPRAVFERLFGASSGTDKAVRLDRLRRDRSILDTIIGQLGPLHAQLGARDRSKVNEYLESVRDVERRIQLAEAQSDREIPVIEEPAGIPDTFGAYAKVQFDLMLLAYQTDMTRVATLLMGREKSSRTFPEIGVPEPHHPTSHHQNRPELLEKLERINRYHVENIAYFVKKLAETPDGDGTLLDNMILLVGGGISNGDIHFHRDLPTMLVGGGAGRVAGNRHLRLPADTPMANLHVTILDRMGLPVEKLGDSTGTLKELTAI